MGCVVPLHEVLGEAGGLLAHPGQRPPAPLVLVQKPFPGH